MGYNEQPGTTRMELALLSLSFLNLYGHLWLPGVEPEAMNTKINNDFSSKVSGFLKDSYLWGYLEPSTGPGTQEAFNVCWEDTLAGAQRGKTHTQTAMQYD